MTKQEIEECKKTYWVEFRDSIDLYQNYMNKNLLSPSAYTKAINDQTRQYEKKIIDLFHRLSWEDQITLYYVHPHTCILELLDPVQLSAVRIMA